jgi:hypothetical protein
MSRRPSRALAGVGSAAGCLALTAALGLVAAGCGGSSSSGERSRATSAMPSASGQAGAAPGAERDGDLETYADHAAAAYKAGFTAYVWGAPLVTMTRTHDRLTCVAPENTMINVTRLATPDSRSVVGPNNDTIYSTSFLDVRDRPVVLGLPEIKNRYYSFQFLDMYTNTISNVGSRTTGQGPARFAVTGPGWHGTLPPGVRQIASPTPEVWMIGRTLVDGQADLPNVIALQKKYTLTPLAGGSATTPASGTAAPGTAGKGAATPNCAKLTDPQDLVSGGLRFLDELGRDMKANPPPSTDRQTLDLLAAAGIGPDKTPSTGTDAGVRDGLSRGLAAGERLVADPPSAPVDPVGHWTTSFDIGTYGQRYVTRAVVARSGLAANVPDESLYYRAAADADGTPLDGRKNYMIHFAPGQLPPVDRLGFWSLTMYDTSHFLVANRLDRYSLGDRSHGLARNKDGSLDVYLGSRPPARHESNWLPAPAAPFSVTLRVYVPAKAALERSWHPAELKRCATTCG